MKQPQTSNDVFLARSAWGAAGTWVAALAVIAAASLAAGDRGADLVVLSAIGAAPALALALARTARRTRTGRSALVFLWTLTAVSVCALSGAGGAGTLAWFVAPAIVAGLLGGRGAAVEAGLLAAAGLAATVATRALGLAPVAGAGLDSLIWGQLCALAPLALFGWAAIAHAADERRLIAAGLRRAQALDRLFAAAPDAFLRLGPDGRVRAAHGAVGPRLGEDAGRLVGQRLDALVDEADRARVMIGVDRAAGLGASDEIVVRRGGEPLVVRFEPLDAGEALAALRASGVQEAQLAAVRAERDAAVQASAARARYFASLSHEFRTPLNAVLGFSDVMRAKLFGPITPRYAEYAGLIHESADHLLSLINGMLDFAKIEAGRYEIAPERLDVRACVDSAARLTSGLAEAKALTFRVEPMPAPLFADADPRALKQILLNLISNAVKFTPEAGRIEVRAHRRDAFIVLDVRDTGPGVPPSELVKLGRPFEQSEAGKKSGEAGTGLGLAIVRALAELHGGGLEIESEVGRGSSFRVRIPAVEGELTGVTRLDARGQQERIRRAVRGAAEAGG